MTEEIEKIRDELASKWWVAGDKHSDISFKAGWDAAIEELKAQCVEFKRDDASISFRHYCPTKNMTPEEHYLEGAYWQFDEFRVQLGAYSSSARGNTST